MIRAARIKNSPRLRAVLVVLRRGGSIEGEDIAGYREFLVIPYGRHELAGGGYYDLDEAGAAAIVAEFESRKNDMVIDYEHQTLSGGEAPAAGWIKELIFRAPQGRGLDSPVEPGNDENGQAPGIWAVVEWTERAKQYLRSREYRYHSPVLGVLDHRAVRLINVALTNAPAIAGVEPVLNKREEGNVMNLEIVRALGLSEGAGVVEVVATIQALKQGAAMVDRVKDLEAENADLRATALALAAEELVVCAMSVGKLAPAQRDWALAYAGVDPEGFKIFAAKAPVIVAPVEPRVPSNGGRPRPHSQIDAAQRIINAALDLTDETFGKYAAKEESV